LKDHFDLEEKEFLPENGSLLSLPHVFAPKKLTLFHGATQDIVHDVCQESFERRRSDQILLDKSKQ
jgi:hypothetical protein